jgi:beta-lactamase class A
VKRLGAAIVLTAVLAAVGAAVQPLAQARQISAEVWAGGSWGGVSPPQAPAPGATNPLPPPAGKVRPWFDALQAQVLSLFQAAGASGAVTLVELGGREPRTWSLNGDQPLLAASTYKLPLLVEQAEKIAAGGEHPGDLLCYQSQDWEDGWFTDYSDGSCFTRAELMQRIGEYSDNTAAHMLVRYEGDGPALNDYAARHGATASAFYDPNTTTSNDLARLWVTEAHGGAGGTAAQKYLYPLLANTSTEEGIPAGVPARGVSHKTGVLGDQVNDAGLVKGPAGDYVLAVCTAGPAGDGGWKLVADVSRAVWQYELGR